MTDQTLESQAKSYANELNTFAYEYGFSKQEGWLIVLTSDAKKAEIEKKFYPTLSIAIVPELADEFQSLVIAKLKHLISLTCNKTQTKSSIKSEH